MNDRIRKEEVELNAFREFAAACPLNLKVDTAENRKPPEPDIRCDTIGDGTIAFELVEADDETDDKAKPGKSIAYNSVVMKNHTLACAIERAFVQGVKDGEICNPERFFYHSITIRFKDTATKKTCSRAISDILSTLNQHGTGSHSLKKSQVVSILCEPFPTQGAYKGPMFHVNSNYCPVGIAVVPRIRDKIKKTYETTLPIHLVVWTYSHAAGIVGLWQKEFSNLIDSEGSGPFECIWVFSRNSNEVILTWSHPSKT
ncbi:MAG: hypothetical protein KF688_02450 [Pirellulales bacterium]|nr:hypothetical protein [Pirellulales bacterium]